MLGCGTFRLVYDIDQETLWVAAGEGKKQDNFEVKAPLEVFGFGSGDFLEGPNAKDVQSDLTGRWLSFSISSPTEYCIMEADRRLPDHIKKIDIFGKVCWLCWIMFFFKNLFNVEPSCLGLVRMFGAPRSLPMVLSSKTWKMPGR